MYYHSRKNRKKYLSFPKAVICPFCDPAELQARTIRETEHNIVMPNRVFYDQWETRDVTDHLLLFPKKHEIHLAAMDDDAKLDMMHIMGEYEDKGYEIYTRSHTNIQRSQDHLHIHLIKTETARARGMFFWNKPYILWRFK